MRAVAAHARRTMARSAALFARKASAKEKHDSACNDLVPADPGLAEARAVVERRCLDLGIATLRAPIDGDVAGGLGDLGGLAAPGDDKPLAVVWGLGASSSTCACPPKDWTPCLWRPKRALAPGASCPTAPQP